MAYSNFTLEDIKQWFGVRNRVRRLFPALPPLVPSDWLKTTSNIAANLPVRSEKAKSEAIVFPILAEMRVRNDNFFTIYSGDSLNVDEQKGLNGECDFILAREIGSFTIDTRKYYPNELGEIMAVFQNIIDYYKAKNI